MVFSSLFFLWMFLPAVFSIHGLIKPQYANLFLLLASLFFYAWGEPVRVFLLAGMIVMNHGVGKAIERYGGWILVIGVVCDLGVLAFYKYAGFLIRIVNDLAGREIWQEPQILLPAGISFFTFQAVSYLADIYRGKTKAQHSLAHTALYISFFPQLIAGPIVKYTDMEHQLENRTVSGKKTACGFRRFIYGLAKKVLISDVLGKSADLVFSMNVTSVGSRMAWCASLFYTFQIYYDFSGYSDMAIGLGGMFGFEIPENFNDPYLSHSVGEFWRRWHISLGTWFREYVYIPLGGNRKGKGRTYINLMIVFFLTGLWHGVDYTFIVWGFYHGFFVLLERAGWMECITKRRVISWCYLFLTVNFGWVIFRSDNLKSGLLFIKRMLLPWLYAGADIPAGKYISGMTVFVAVCAVFGAGGGKKLLSAKALKRWEGSAAEMVCCAVLLILCIAGAADSAYSPFIYFQF